jgi:hypothetical protein
MLKSVSLLLITLISIKSYAQSSDITYIDSLYASRNFMHTDVYQNQIKLTKSKFSTLLSENTKWSRKNKIANIILPVGPFISLGGIYLAYDAIKGIPMVYVENGTEYPYVVRSLPKLLGGLAAFVTGLSLMESANETKTNAANWYNGKVDTNLNAKKSAFRLKIGITNSGGMGLAANF